MGDTELYLACLRDPRLAAHATSAHPAWLWSLDGTRSLWANASGAALLGAKNPAELNARMLDEGDAMRAQIARLGASLPRNEKPRLERLRGFGSDLGRLLTCACSRITLGDQTAVLVAATERAGPELSLRERVQRLHAAIKAPIAVFSADGALLYADKTLAPRLGDDKTLAALGAASLAAEALRTGHAQGMIDGVAASLDRVGSSAATVLVAWFAQPAAVARPMQAIDAPRPMGSRARVEVPSGQAPAEPAGLADIIGKAADSISIDAEAGRAEGLGELPAPSAASKPSAQPPARRLQRRHPLRFVWQMDGDGRFTISSEEFTRLVGPQTSAVLGNSWNAIAAELALDPDGQVAQAAASQDTWSGITVAWPVDGSKERLGIELSGLPVFDRQRSFRGYRGFGVCRDLARLSALARQRKVAPAAPRDEPPATMQAGATANDGATPGPQHPPTPAPEASAAEVRPVLTIVPPAKNVVPFRVAGSDGRSPSFGPVERTAFRELAQRLSARLGIANVDEHAAPPAGGEGGLGQAAEAAPARDVPRQTAETMLAKGPSAPGPSAQLVETERAAGRVEAAPANRAPTPTETQAILDDVPAGVLIYRLSDLLYANRAFLDWAGYPDIDALAADGGLDSLLVEPSPGRQEADGGGKMLTLTSGRSGHVPVEARLLTASWDGETVLMLIIAAPLANDRHRADEKILRDAQARIGKLEAILDIASDAIIVLDGAGSILASNASAQALFGRDPPEMLGHSFTDLLAPESHRAAHDCLDALTRNESPGIVEPEREMIGRRAGGETIPLSMTMRRVGTATPELCAVFRNRAPWKKAEAEQLHAKLQAERAASAKANVLAKVSHEVRTPLNAIIGFCEVMMEERFGPIGNDRYREYLRDIHASGGHLISLINDLLDLSKIESGKLELSAAPIALNDLTQQCVAIMQSQANRERIIIRTSLSTKLPPVLADARSVRQIVLNLLANSIALTNAGGQVIVSTALSDAGEVVLRVRDTGIGMSEQDIKTALEPFRQLATTSRGGGTSLGLALTKALAEANRASFSITSVVDAGTLVEVAFPPTQVLAE